MARTYPVVPHTVFGGSAAGAPNGIAQFGSKQTGTPDYTTNIATIQALAAWLQGWAGAVVQGKVPPLEELNAAFLEPSYQIASLFECGIPDWNSGITYSTNSVCQSGGLIYQSLIDGNIGNAPVSNPSDWKIQSSNVFLGELSPAAIATSQNNYNPAGWGPNVYNLILSTSNVGGISLTGLLKNVNGQVINILNTIASLGNITISFNDSSSSSANRFVAGSGSPTLVIPPANAPGANYSCAQFYYSGILGGWLFLSKNF